MTWSILCNLFFLYNKKRHGRILFFHTYYLLLYSTRYTFFSIICVSCTYFPLRVNWIHSIHAYHLYLILHPGSADLLCEIKQQARAASLSFQWKIPGFFSAWEAGVFCTALQTSSCQSSDTFLPESFPYL